MGPTSFLEHRAAYLPEEQASPSAYSHAYWESAVDHRGGGDLRPVVKGPWSALAQRKRREAPPNPLVSLMMIPVDGLASYLYKLFLIK